MPNPKPPIPPKIEDIGLKKYLEGTKDEHNGSGYDELVKRLNLSEPKTVIARAFGVHSTTIRYWIVIYEEESAKEGRRSGN